MDEFKLGDVLNQCTHLSSLTKKNIQKILAISKLCQDEDISIGEALCFWVSDLLISTKIIDSEQVTFILDNIFIQVKIFGNELELNIKSDKLPVCKLCILDRTIICIDGRDGFILFKTGENIETLITMPLETITYNLTKVYTNQSNKLKNKEKNVKSL